MYVTFNHIVLCCMPSQGPDFVKMFLSKLKKYLHFILIDMAFSLSISYH